MHLYLIAKMHGGTQGKAIHSSVCLIVVATNFYLFLDILKTGKSLLPQQTILTVY